MEKTLPCNLDAERLVLGSVLKNPARLESLALEPADFDLEKHRSIFRAMVDLANDNESIDFATVGSKLRERGELEAEGVSYLISLTDHLPDILSLDSHVRILRDKHLRRLGIAAGQNLMNKCLLDGPSAAEILIEHGAAVELISQKGIGRTRRIRRIEDLPHIETIGSAEIEWDVEGLVPRGTVVLLTGEAGAGKSTFACALAYAVSKGKSFLGRKTSERPVLALDAENPAVAVLERFRRLGIVTDENFRVWGQWCGEDPPAVGGAVVLEWVARCEVKPIVIVDSFIRFHPGAENDATETQKYMAQYRKLAAAGATVIIIHHTGKAENAQDYRGSSDIKASVDIGYKLTQLGDGSRLDFMELRAFKQRISVTPHLHVRYQDGGFTTDEQGGLTATKTVTERLTDLIKANPGITVREFEALAAQRDLGRNRAREFMATRVENGMISRKTEGRTFLHYWGGVGGDVNPQEGLN
ncbi:MAG TPA: AAA family ATPase [Terriglobales bacterium]|nr:AAA family ATPase [Terriglobales bacterium]